MSRRRPTSPPFSFYPNLKPYTFNRGAGNRRFDGYLLSREYARTHHALGAQVVEDGRVLFLDNGLLDDTRRLGNSGVPESSTAADALVAEWQRARDAETSEQLRASEVLGVEDVWSSVLLSHGRALDAGHGKRLVAHAEWTRRWADRLGPDVRVFMPVHVGTFAEARVAGRVLGKHGLAMPLPVVRALQSRRHHTSLEIDRVITWKKSCRAPTSSSSLRCSASSPAIARRLVTRRASIPWALAHRFSCHSWPQPSAPRAA